MENKITPTIGKFKRIEKEGDEYSLGRKNNHNYKLIAQFEIENIKGRATFITNWSHVTINKDTKPLRHTCHYLKFNFTNSSHSGYNGFCNYYRNREDEVGIKDFKLKEWIKHYIQWYYNENRTKIQSGTIKQTSLF